MLGTLLLAAALARPDGNLVRFRTVEGRGLSGTPPSVTDGFLCREESPGTPDRTAVLNDERSVLVVRLDGIRQIRGVLLQCEADDDYLVERSLDGHTWFGLLHVKAALHAKGLQTQAVDFAAPQPALFLAVHARGGDGHFAVSELQAFEVLPDPWPPRPRPLVPRAPPAPQVAPPPLLSETFLRTVRGTLAAAGAALLLWGLFLARCGRAGSFRRTRDALLGTFGLLALASWWNLGRLHQGSPVHVWDTFHYYVGAKYFPELGYTGLYECALAAGAEDGVAPAGGTATARNLLTNELERREPAAALPLCRARFSPERWEAFRHDVAWFRLNAGSSWGGILMDHGYNGTPAWGVLGRLLASTGPASAAQIRALTAIDSLLLLAMWGAIVRAFGWRAAAVAALFWGTNDPARFFWNGGAFLRMDWLAAAVGGVCLLKRGRWRWAGALLAVSALLRIFPVFLLAGLAAAAAARALRERRLVPRPEEVRIAEGALLAVALLLPLSILVPGRGARAWPEFVANSRKHLATPLTNNMGLKTLLAFRPESRAARMTSPFTADPFAAWKEARLREERRTAPLHLALAAGAFAVFALAVRGRAPWVVAAAAAGLVPVGAELTCYYASGMLLLALLVAEREEIGPILPAFAAATNLVAALSAWDDERYALASLLALVAVSACWWLLGRHAGRDREESGRPARAPSARAAVVALVLLVSGYVLYVAPETVRQHRALATRAYDLGIFENVLWNTVHGRPFLSALEGGSHLGVHTSFLLLLAAPFYALAPRAETLLVLQTLLLALAAWPLWLVARDLEFPPAAASLVAALWLIHPAVGGANFYDFHELAFGPVLFFAAFHFLLKDRRRSFAVAIALLLLVKEDMALVAAALGVWCLLSGRRGAGAALVAAGVGAYGLLQHVVIPLFGGAARGYSWYYAELIPPGAGPSALLVTLFREPGRAARLVLEPGRLLFAAQLLAPLLFVCLLSLRSAALVAYGLLMTLCASRPELHRIGFQYPLQVLPYAFAGTLDVVSRADRRLPGALRAFLALAAAVSLAVCIRWGMFFPRDRFAAGFRVVEFAHPAAEAERYAAIRRLADRIPQDASVTASETLVPHVARRLDVHTLRYADSGTARDPDYLFVLEDELTPETVSRFTLAGSELVDRGGGALLYRRRRL